MFKTPSQFTPQLSAASSGLPTSHQSAPDSSKSVFAFERAQILLGLYRKGEAENPDVYVTGIAALLSKFDSGVVMFVTGPEGLASTCKFLPTLAEVREACEKRAALFDPSDYAIERQRRVEEQLAARRAFDDEQSAARNARVGELAKAFCGGHAQHGRRKAWEPRPAGSIPPIGPEHGEDLQRLMATPSPRNTGG